MSLFFLFAILNKRSLMITPSSLLSPTTILDGNKLSYAAFPSLRNSGEKYILRFLYLLLHFSTNPMGTVDLIIIIDKHSRSIRF